jgi:hypothetical protein
MEVWALRVERMLLLAIPLFAYDAYASPGVGRVLSGATAVGLTFMALMRRFAGRRGYGFVSLLAGLAGTALLLAAVGLLVAGLWLFAAGSFGILGGLVALPLSLGVGVWGWSLLGMALGPDPAATWREIDEEKARRSPAVRRFDALHAPRLPSAPSAPKHRGDRGSVDSEGV